LKYIDFTEERRNLQGTNKESLLFAPPISRWEPSTLAELFLIRKRGRQHTDGLCIISRHWGERKYATGLVLPKINPNGISFRQVLPWYIKSSKK
jgi:hypothetical protein